MFLDIEMPVLKGVDFFKNLVNKPKVIFTTAYRDYAVEGFELDAVDYLLKPISFARFFKSLEKFESQQTPRVTKEIPKNTHDRCTPRCQIWDHGFSRTTRFPLFANPS